MKRLKKTYSMKIIFLSKKADSARALRTESAWNVNFCIVNYKLKAAISVRSTRWLWEIAIRPEIRTVGVW